MKPVVSGGFRTLTLSNHCLYSLYAGCPIETLSLTSSFEFQKNHKFISFFIHWNCSRTSLAILVIHSNIKIISFMIAFFMGSAFFTAKTWLRAVRRAGDFCEAEISKSAMTQPTRRVKLLRLGHMLVTVGAEKLGDDRMWNSHDLTIQEMRKKEVTMMWICGVSKENEDFKWKIVNDRACHGKPCCHMQHVH